MRDQDEAAIVDEHQIMDTICEIMQSCNSKDLTLSRTTKITSELNVDSMAIMDVIMELEQKFDIDIPINMLYDMDTIGDLADVVSARVKGR